MTQMKSMRHIVKCSENSSFYHYYSTWHLRRAQQFMGMCKYSYNLSNHLESPVPFLQTLLTNCHPLNAYALMCLHMCVYTGSQIHWTNIYWGPTASQALGSEDRTETQETWFFLSRSLPSSQRAGEVNRQLQPDAHSQISAQPPVFLAGSPGISQLS